MTSPYHFFVLCPQRSIKFLWNQCDFCTFPQNGEILLRNDLLSLILIFLRPGIESWDVRLRCNVTGCIFFAEVLQDLLSRTFCLIFSYHSQDQTNLNNASLSTQPELCRLFDYADLYAKMIGWLPCRISPSLLGTPNDLFFRRLDFNKGNLSLLFGNQ